MRLSRSTTREDDESKSDPCHSRKGESPGPSRRDVSPDPSRRGESSCSSYRDESPGTSYTDRSIRDRSTSPSHKEISSHSPGPSQRESFDRSSIEISSGPGHKDKSPDSDSKSKAKIRKDKYQSGQGSKSSDSMKKEKSLSFSIKDGSYDSSHRDSFSPSHKDETYSDQKEISPVCIDSKTDNYPRQESSSLSHIEYLDEEPSDKEKSPKTSQIAETLSVKIEIIDNNQKDKPQSSSSSPSCEDKWQSLKEVYPKMIQKEPIMKEPIPGLSRDIFMTSISTISEMSQDGSTLTEYVSSSLSR